MADEVEVLEQQVEAFQKLYQTVETLGNKQIQPFIDSICALNVDDVIQAAEPTDQLPISSFKRLIRGISGRGQDVVRSFMQSVNIFLWSIQEQRRRAVVFLVGLKGAGKTSLLLDLVTGIPTDNTRADGYHLEKYTFCERDFVIWNLGVADTPQSWEEFFSKDISLVVFVVDATEADRFTEAKAELDKVLSQKKLKSIPLVVLANKSDADNAISLVKIAQGMNLPHLNATRPWKIIPTSLIHGDLYIRFLVDGLKAMGSTDSTINHLIAEYAVPMTGLQLAFDWYVRFGCL